MNFALIEMLTHLKTKTTRNKKITTENNININKTKNNTMKKLKNKKPVVTENKNQRKITEMFKPKLNEQHQDSDSVKANANSRNNTREITELESPVSKARGQLNEKT